MQQSRFGLMLPRIGVGLFFLVFGLMKVMDPAFFAGMINNIFGFTGIIQTITVWLVILTEIGGEIFILARSRVGKFYKLALLGVLVMVFSL